MSAFSHITLALALLGLLSANVNGFAPVQKRTTIIDSKLMAGFGATATKSNKKKTKQGASFDVSASLSRLEKQYEEIMRASAKQMARADDDPRWKSAEDEEQEETITSEFMIAARSSSKKGVDDWVPIAQLCIAYPESNYHEGNREILQTAVSAYCREISHVAGMGAQVFTSVARNDMQYSVEPIDSFFKHVYESVIEENKQKKTMTKAEARTVLGLHDETEIDKSKIKQAYRKLSFELHPDRLEESANKEDAAERFEKVQVAYDALTSGVRENGKSWYESLGGKARTDFHRIELLSLADAKEKMEAKRIQGAIMGLDNELVQSFVARNLRSQ